jgi:predicted nucleotidyltransferase
MKAELFKKLEAIKKQLEQNGHHVIAIFLQGSQNYGLEINQDDYVSDIDAKAFIMPSFEDLYFNKFISITKETEFGLVDVKDIRHWIELLKKSNPSYIELLFTEYRILDDEKLVEGAEELVNERMPKLMRTCLGMIDQKIKALKHPYPTIIDKIEKYGYDPKQLHHIVRLYYIIRDLMIGEKTYAEILKPQGLEKEFLLKLKMGEFSLDEAEVLANSYRELAAVIVDDTPIEGLISNNTINKIERTVLELVKSNITGGRNES